MLQLLQGTIADTPISDLLNSGIRISEVDVTKKKSLSELIGILFQKVILSSGRFFWSFLFGDLNWNQIWLNGGRFCLSNKIKGVIFIILHNLFPVKKTLERFRIDIGDLFTF